MGRFSSPAARFPCGASSIAEAPAGGGVGAPASTEPVASAAPVSVAGAGAADASGSTRSAVGSQAEAVPMMASMSRTAGRRMGMSVSRSAAR